MKTTYHQIQDFLNDDSFVQWVLAGRDDSRWQKYLGDHPDKLDVITEAKKIIGEIQTAEQNQLPLLDQQIVWNRIKIKLQSSGNSKPVSVRPILLFGLGRWAAILIFLVGIGWSVWQATNSGTQTYQKLVATIQEKDALVEKANGGSVPIKVALEDGSTITLSPGSKLSYPSRFSNASRKVVLSGEAFFDVARDSSRPFYIYSNEVITKVLGTSFSIRAFEEDKEVVVQVKTGRVSVYKQEPTGQLDPETNGLVLLPNQQAIFSRASENLSRRLVEVPQPVAVAPLPNRQIRYDEVAASQILRDIERRYGITILFDEVVLDHCILTTTLGDESLYDQLDLLCRTIGASYKEVDAQLIIESKGCK